jgi:hypothetical protein
MEDPTPTARRTPFWLWASAGLGVSWNAFGIVQLLSTLGGTEATGMMKGMSAEAAAVYYHLPIWMNVAFATGAIGGLLGSLVMFARSTLAVMIFAVSSVGYVVLFLGDWHFELFRLMPGQLPILLVVLAISFVLLLVSAVAARKGILV